MGVPREDIVLGLQPTHKRQYKDYSDYYMRRARAIATIVLGSRGIAVTPVVVSSQGEKSESLVRVLRDCGRSVLWVLSGRSGAGFNPRLRMKEQ